MMTDKERAIAEVQNLSKEQVAKVLIFLAGMEAGQSLPLEHDDESNT